MAWQWRGYDDWQWGDDRWQDHDEQQQELEADGQVQADGQADQWQQRQGNWMGWWGDRGWSWHDRPWTYWDRQWHWNQPWAYDDSRNAGMNEGRRASLQVSEETNWDGRRGSDTSEMHDAVPGDVPSVEGEEPAAGSQAASSNQSRPREPKTGKDIIPSYDGSTSVRDFRRRVQLFEASTGIDPEFRAGRLVEQMTGLAWKSTETLDLSRLRSSGGVEYLLSHLQQELEPVEYIRVFETLHHFFWNFRREKGESFVNFDMNFRAQMQKLDEVGAGLTGIVKSWWFLETASLGQELRKQVVTASGGSYQYERLREALMAIVPSVKREDDDRHPTGQPNSANPVRTKFYVQKNVKINKVNIVDDDAPQVQEPDEHGDGGVPEDEEPDPEELERQARVLITQASKRRAQAEQARGFTKNETAEQRQARIASLKARMPCSACKANGRTTYGHWHSDPECPFFGKGDGKASKGVFVVAQENEVLSTDSEEVFMVNVNTVYGTELASIPSNGQLLALSDTCCARTVAGSKWMDRTMKELWRAGANFYVLRERQGFRFDAGPRIWSEYSVVLPTFLGEGKRSVFLRVSVVPVDVPLLCWSADKFCWIWVQ